MHTTPFARYAPRRMVVPPGTTRTLSVTAKLRGTSVSLSKKENGPLDRPLASRGDWSASVPRRNAWRMPRFTHGTACHVPSAARPCRPHRSRFERIHQRFDGDADRRVINSRLGRTPRLRQGVDADAQLGGRGGSRQSRHDVILGR